MLTRGASKSLEPGDHPGDHLGREGLLDVFIFRDLAGDAVLEEVVQAILLRSHPLRQRLHPRAFVAGSATS